MKGQRVMHSSTEATENGGEWETPPEVLEVLARRWGPFVLDAAATPTNHKAPVFFTRADDGLARDWGHAFRVACRAHGVLAGGAVWLNPKYGRAIGLWMRKARREAVLHGLTVVCLVPYRPDTAWWRRHVTGAEEPLAPIQPGDIPGAWLGGMVTLGGERVMRWAGLETTITEWPGDTGLPSRIRFIQPGRGAESAPFPSAVVCYRGLRLGQ